MNQFLNKLKAKWDEGKFVCVGLDQGDFESNQSVIDATFDLVCSYKPNAAFYSVSYAYKESELDKTVSYIKDNHPDILIILDAKLGDVSHTNEAYVKEIFDTLGVDAVTVNPYLGKEALQPFLDRADKGILILVKTSNPGAGEFQDLQISGKPLYQVVAEHVVSWNTNNNLAVVVGATYPEELAIVRKIIGDMPILVPGIGEQGGNLEDIFKNGLNSQKQGLIINSSRGIIFAPNPREVTQALHSKIQEILAHV
ncbi:MAG: Orotidine 5'-phosphate decarboxylase [Microgenomates group bacterium Gr01-1014_7]|nr:MAG: Orotidine 5'-phosphate decarboxylase [Microgenomates group bacterium Gr01-1014_7]